MESIFLCYDLKGIQSYIFAVPRLKFICGGSAIVDRFDKEKVAKAETAVSGAKLLFAGGGKGAFLCDSNAAANALKHYLVQLAHTDGLNICFGLDSDYSEAAHYAAESYPWLPESTELDGHPCSESGLYPAQGGGVNEKVKLRREKSLVRRFEDMLLADLALPPYFGEKANWQFMRDVEGDASKALGSRNRWAVITMDGNDMGSQYQAASSHFKTDITGLSDWIAKMSKALDACSRGACQAAIERVLKEWGGSEDGGAYLGKAKGGPVHLPIRPLVVGGDDIIVLCHVSYARTFVKEAARVFAEQSASMAEKMASDTFALWPATNGVLSITAGILFAPVSLPLASAIPYAEMLMANAKGHGREREEAPSPACVDWESVTEGVIDTPAARRHRELIFKDGDTGARIELTQRPYTLEDFKGVEELMKKYEKEKIPASIRHQVLPGMRAGKADRQVFLARLGKNQEDLVDDLRELDDKASTHVIDALLLMEEDVRMSRTTVEEDV